MDAKGEKIALFRYGLIAPLVLETLPRGELTRRAEGIAARQYEIPGSKRTSVCVDTPLDWVLRYRSGGFEALARKPRQDRGQSRTITPQLADLIERLKRENPHRHHPPARISSVRAKRAGHLRIDSLSFPQASRPVGKATALSAAAQRVRSRAQQPDLAITL